MVEIVISRTSVAGAKFTYPFTSKVLNLASEIYTSRKEMERFLSVVPLKCPV